MVTPDKLNNWMENRELDCESDVFFKMCSALSPYVLFFLVQAAFYPVWGTFQSFAPAVHRPKKRLKLHAGSKHH